MAQSSIALLDVDKIDIEEGFNARTHMDEDELARLTASVSKAGVVQAILVRPAPEGRYFLVAGERRLTAARNSDTKQIPGVIREGTRAEAIRDSMLENMHREQLDDIDQAHGVQALAEEWDLHTNQEIADKLDLKVERVALLRRLLKLPEGVQSYIATGVVPTRAERQLREIAKTSPRIAECVCEYAKRKKIDHVTFVRDFGEILIATSMASFEDGPTMIRPERIALKRIVADKDKRRELVDRFNASVAYADLASEDPILALREPEIDAARAAGCLLEYVVDNREFFQPVLLITDTELAADLVERRIEGREAEAEASAKVGSSPEEQAALSDQRKAEYQQREKDKVKAEGFNEELLAGLVNRNAAARRKHGLARKKAIAKILIANNPDLVGAGLRLVRPALKDTQTKTTKAGEPRIKVKYAEPFQATAWLSERIDGTRSEAEVDDLLTEAIVCALVADGNAVARTKRVGWHCRVADEVAELLAAEIEEVTPQRAPKASAKKRSRGAAKKAGRKAAA